MCLLYSLSESFLEVGAASLDSATTAQARRCSCSAILAQGKGTEQRSYRTAAVPSGNLREMQIAAARKKDLETTISAAADAQADKRGVSASNAKAGQLSQKLAMERRTSGAAVQTKGNPNERMMVSFVPLLQADFLRTLGNGTRPLQYSLDVSTHMRRLPVSRGC